MKHSVFEVIDGAEWDEIESDDGGLIIIFYHGDHCTIVKNGKKLLEIDLSLTPDIDEEDIDRFPFWLLVQIEEGINIG